MRELGYKVAFAVALVAGVWVAASTLERALGSDRLTAPRRLEWRATASDSSPPAQRPECLGDPQLRTLLRDETLWSSCLPGPGRPGGAYVRYVPAEGVAQLRWDLPEALPLERTEGLRPGPYGQLALVYRATTGQLVGALAGPDGWTRSPEPFSSGANPLLLGLDWRGASVELVWSPSASVLQADGWNAPTITTLHADGTVSQRVLDRAVICDPRWLRCGVQAAYRQPGASVWRLLVSAAEPAMLWNVVETGIRHPVTGFDFPWDARDDTDLTASGLLIEAALRLRGVFTVQGDFTPLAGDVVAEYAGWAHDYQAADAALEWRAQFALAGSTVFVDEGAAGVAGVESSSERPDVLIAYRYQNGEVTSRGVVARLTADCPQLPAAILVPRATGGHWLVSPAGCFLALGAASERADPLDLLTHLATAGSQCSDCRYPGPVLAFFWVMLGLPISIGATLGGAHLRYRRRAPSLRPHPVALLVLPLLLYDVTAALLLIELLPMLG